MTLTTYSACSYEDTMPIVTWNVRDEEGRLIEVQAEVVDAGSLELTEPETPVEDEEP